MLKKKIVFFYFEPEDIPSFSTGLILLCSLLKKNNNLLLSNIKNAKVYKRTFHRAYCELINV